MRFTTVLRARSRAKVRGTDPPLILQNFPSPVGPLTIVIRTRYDEKEFGIPVPRELWVEAQGDAPSLEDGLNATWGATASVIPVIALTTNAAVGDLQPHLAFETTEGVEDRAFFQSTVETERGIPPPGRRVPIEATVATLEAIAKTGRAYEGTAARLMRAANQYLLALRYWKRHHELLCVSHLFMAAETLKVVALRNALRDAGVDEAELARLWSIRPGEPRTRQLLEAAARRRLVFHGDDDIESKAADVSDGFEHGYRDLGDLHSPSLNIRDKTGRHVRGAFLELAGVADVARAELTSGRYEDPIDMTEYVRYVRGRLVGPGDDLAPADEEYPYLEWTSAPTLTDPGEGKITISGRRTSQFEPPTQSVSGPSPMSSGGLAWTYLRKTRLRNKAVQGLQFAESPPSGPRKPFVDVVRGIARLPEVNHAVGEHGRLVEEVGGQGFAPEKASCEQLPELRVDAMDSGIGPKIYLNHHDRWCSDSLK